MNRLALAVDLALAAAPAFADEAGEPLHFRPSLAVGGFILFPSAPNEPTPSPILP